MKQSNLGKTSDLAAPLNLEDLAHSVREMTVDVLETEATQVLSRWYHSPKDVDLFIWSDDHNVVLKHQLSFMGQVIEWSVFDGIRTGMVIETETIADEQDCAETIQFDTNLSKLSIEQGVLILRQIPNLFEKEQILRHYSSGAEFAGDLRANLLKKYDFAICWFRARLFLSLP